MTIRYENIAIIIIWLKIIKIAGEASNFVYFRASCLKEIGNSRYFSIEKSPKTVEIERMSNKRHLAFFEKIPNFFKMRLLGDFQTLWAQPVRLPMHISFFVSGCQSISPHISQPSFSMGGVGKKVTNFQWNLFSFQASLKSLGGSAEIQFEEIICVRKKKNLISVVLWPPSLQLALLL